MDYAPALRHPNGDIVYIDEGPWSVLEVAQSVAVHEVIVRALRGDNLRGCELLVVGYQDHRRIFARFDTTTCDWEPE